MCLKPTSTQLHGQPKQKKTGAELWKTAAHKMHAYHAVTHQLQHRASEKVGFGVAEHLLERLAEATLERAHGHASHAHAVHAARGPDWLRRAVEKPAALLRNATCSVRSLGPAAVHCPKPVVVVPTRAERAWAASLDGAKIAIPFAGACLVAHMAHHDLHRAQHEQHKRGRCLTTLLFFAAFAFDALDAAAHAFIAAALLGEQLLDPATLHDLHVDHHLVHEVHHATLLLAVCATLCMAIGELLSLRAAKPITSLLRAAALAEAKKAH